MMNDAGQRLKRARERLNLRFRDVEQASIRIAELRQNDLIRQAYLGEMVIT